MKSQTLSLYVLMDGLGWDIAQRCRAFDFLEGDRSALDTVLGYSSTAIPTILTGKMPDEHGIWNLFYRDEQQTDFPLLRPLEWLPNRFPGSRHLRKALLLANKRFTGFEGYYQAYEFPGSRLPKIRISENRNIYGLNGVEGSATLFDTWHANGTTFLAYSYKQYSDEAILSRVYPDVKANRPQACFIYLSGFDAYGHRHAGNVDAMVAEANTYGARLKELTLQLETLYDQVNVHLFSDHGMVPIQGVVDVEKALADHEIDFDSHFWILDSTMARFYVENPEEEERIRNALRGLPGRFLTEEDRRNYRIDFDNRYGDLIYLVDPGIQIVPSHMSRTPLPGMHGYEPSYPGMMASYLSNVHLEHPPKAIWDLYSLMTTKKPAPSEVCHA